MMRLLLILLLFSSQSFALVLPVVVEEKVLKDYQAFVNDRDPLTIDDFTGPKARRSTVEIVLLQQAFMLGGVPVTLEFHTAYVDAARLCHGSEHHLGFRSGWGWRSFMGQ